MSIFSSTLYGLMISKLAGKVEDLIPGAGSCSTSYFCTECGMILLLVLET